MESQTQPSEKTIGGWLFVVPIALVLFVVRTVSYLLMVVALWNKGMWPALTAPNSQNFNFLWAFGSIFEVVANVLLLAMSAVLLFLFFKRRHIFPKLAIIFVIALVVVGIVDLLIGMAIPEIAERLRPPWRNLALMMIFSAVAVLYFMVSHRVKTTFIR